MRVRVIKSFVGHLPDGRSMLGQLGDEFDLPDGTDWLKAGFVEPVGNPPAARAENAGSMKAKGRSRRGA